MEPVYLIRITTNSGTREIILHKAKEDNYGNVKDLLKITVSEFILGGDQLMLTVHGLPHMSQMLTLTTVETEIYL